MHGLQQSRYIPLMHQIDERRRENDRLKLIQAIVYCSRAVPVWKRAERGEPLVAGGGGASQPNSKGHDEGSEGAVLDFPNSLFIGQFLDVFVRVFGGRRKEVVCLMEHGG